MSAQHRVVVTGIGLITSIGIGKDTVWQAMMDGRSGGRRLEYPWADQDRFNCRVGAPVEGFDPARAGVSPREADLLDRVSLYALAATREALTDAGFGLEAVNGKRSGYRVKELESERLSVILGTGIGGVTTMSHSHRRWVEDLPLKRYTLPMLIPNAPPAQVAIRFNARGECKAIATACAAGTMAAGDAFRSIRLGESDVVIAGGVEAAMPDSDGWGFKGFDMLKAMSTRNEDAARASRPFDKNRDGFVLSEGAGILILEREEFAKARGARIYAEIRGYEANCDAYHMVMLEPEGRMITHMMKRLLKKSGVDPRDVQYINAHGTSTPNNDRTETASIRRVFGKHADNLMVSSTKSMTGHGIGAAGGIEAAATALAIHYGRVPPTINYEVPDPACDLNYVPNKPADRQVDLALSNSYAFGGHNASLLFAHYPRTR